MRIPWEGGEALDVTPDHSVYAMSLPEFSRDGRRIAFTSATREGFRVYSAPLTKDAVIGEWRQLYHAPTMLMGMALSADSTLLAVGCTERSGTMDASLVVIDTCTGERTAELHDRGNSIGLVRFSPTAGDPRICAVTDRSGFDRPLTWNPLTGERNDLALPGITGEVGITDWSTDATKLLLRHFHQAVQRIGTCELKSGDSHWPDHPGGTIGGAWFGEHDEIWANHSSSEHPVRTIVMNEVSGDTLRVALEGEPAPSGHRWRSIQFASSGGASIQGWLATPPGAGPFPTIIETHGGPTAVAAESYHRQGHAWVDHGFAFLTINYRGSYTFGYDFENAIHGHLGDLEVDDIVAARDWLVAIGIALPSKILLTGWSYGGYLTLQALGRAPDLWAGGMAGIAIADWGLMYEDQNEGLRRYQQALFGGSPEQLPAEHRAASPITYIANVQAPVLVIQGSNDTRCPPRQLRAYEERMLELGKDIEVDWFDAGHGAFSIEMQVAHQLRMLQFAEKLVGKRLEG